MPPKRFSKSSTFNKAELVDDNLQTPKRRNLNGISGPRNQINQSAAADSSFGPPSALRQKSHIGNMLPLARLEDEPESGAIFVYLFISASLNLRQFREKFLGGALATVTFDVIQGTFVSLLGLGGTGVGDQRNQITQVACITNR